MINIIGYILLIAFIIYLITLMFIDLYMLFKITKKDLEDWYKWGH